ncbi:glycosyltransferase [Yasminevirus sp. GU-2018]|uniref:Glycosyltransferase n=1 Tax=Yasminevirus sp. GU-2018 TaxID=2420051 RepID=A0A5K0U9X1_9VIRU|nr:glycosyltransferase [Yasminevirus sp. GU-2018]
MSKLSSELSRSSDNSFWSAVTNQILSRLTGRVPEILEIEGRLEHNTRTPDKINDTNTSGVVTVDPNADIDPSEDLLSLVKKDSGLRNIIVSLHVEPTQLSGDKFVSLLEVFESIAEQTLPAKCVVVHTSPDVLDSNQDENLKAIQTKHPDFLIVRSTNYGKLTNLLGMISMLNNQYFDNDDRVVFVDSHNKIKRNTLFYYELCYQLYNCDAVITSNNSVVTSNNPKDKILYRSTDNRIIADGELSYSLKWFCLSRDMCDVFDTFCKSETFKKRNSNGLFFTEYVREKKLNVCSMNLGSAKLAEQPGVKIDFDANIKKNSDQVSEPSTTADKSTVVEYKIRKVVKPRYLLRNVLSIDYDRDYNVNDIHVDFKHLNNKKVIMTVTIFNNNTMHDRFSVKQSGVTSNTADAGVLQSVDIVKSKDLKVYSQILNIDNLSETWDNIPNVPLFQTAGSAKMSQSKFNSTRTIISNVPYLTYLFFDDDDCVKFIREDYPRLIHVYNKIRPGAFKADMFRALYAYKNGGVYFDCKQSLFASIKTALSKKRMLVKDIPVDHVYNGTFYIQPRDEIFRDYLVLMIKNVHMSLYGENPLDVTGPRTLGRVAKLSKDAFAFFRNPNDTPDTDMNINDAVIFQNTSDSWFICDNSIIRRNGSRLIKHTYTGYYEENNYWRTKHYGVMWRNSEVFNDYNVHIESDLIKHVLWINLDRSTDRYKKMENVLKCINIPNTRISAVDGKYPKITLPKREGITNSEIACCMSHIKAITAVSNLQLNNNEYVLILEDDVTLDNTILFTDTIDDIIRKVPKHMADFDILMLYKTYHSDLDDTYVSWNDHLNKGPDHLYHIAGGVSYVVKKSFAQSFANTVAKCDNTGFTKFVDRPLDVSDKFIFVNAKTITYRYNYFATQTEKSTIHQDHIDLHKKNSDYQLSLIINSAIGDNQLSGPKSR